MGFPSGLYEEEEEEEEAAHTSGAWMLTVMCWVFTDLTHFLSHCPDYIHTNMVLKLWPTTIIWELNEIK